jgi:hypothetical protein
MRVIGRTPRERVKECILGKVEGDMRENMCKIAEMG